MTIDPSLVPVVLIAVLLTSFLSGIFGMAGGLILMGVLGALFPVNVAMVLHGASQLIANGFRAATLFRHVEWRPMSWFIGGSLVAAAALGSLQFIPSKPLFFLILGAIPFLSLVPRVPRLYFERPRHALLAGVAFTSLQLVAGVSGPLLDFFFLHGERTRFQNIATKAVASSIGHLIKFFYFGTLLASAEIAPSAYVWIAAASIAGTLGGGYVLRRMNDENFRTYSRRLILVIGSVYLVKGFAAL